MKQNDKKLSKETLSIRFLPNYIALITVILGLIITSMIPVAMAGATMQTAQDGPSQVGILGSLTPNNKAMGLSHVPVCPGPAGKDSTRCHAQVIIDTQGNPQAATTPNGYGPAQLLAAYNLGHGTATTNQIIAIVDAYDHPNIKSDLDIYNAQFGLPIFPLCSATVTTGCFKKVDQRGGTKYPRQNAGWALEIALDVETAHAICQNCTILLVEADSNSFANLITAEETAARLGATVISNSWGGSEFANEVTAAYDGHFNKSGVAITFSSGDAGYGTEYPAASKYVTSVGGTTLSFNSSSNSYSETAWSGAGSGCSAFESQPSFQTILGLSGCTNRMVADVSAVADPNTGAAIYDSVRLQGRSGWFVVGGTSLASPIIAGVYALAGGVGSGVQGNSIPYQLGSAAYLNDVSSGNNGACTVHYLCNAGTGYDGPTGLGTPNGTGAFGN